MKKILFTILLAFAVSVCYPGTPIKSKEERQKIRTERKIERIKKRMSRGKFDQRSGEQKRTDAVMIIGLVALSLILVQDAN